MTKQNHADGNGQQGNNGNNNSRPFGYLYGVVIAGTWAFIVLLLVSLLWPNLTERTKFFTANFWNLVIAFTVIAQVKINRQQWQSMVDGLDRTDDMIENMQGQLTSMQGQEKTMEAQWQAMQQQIQIARIAERAYIGIKEVMLQDLEIGKQPYITVLFLNGGHTPAWKVKAPAALSLSDNFSNERPQMFEKEGSSFLPAGTDRAVHYRIPVTMNAAWLAAINEGSKHIFVNGEVHFEDCWSEKQIFPFQLVYNPKTGQVEDYKETSGEPTVRVIP